MERANSFGREDISTDLPSSFNIESIEVMESKPDSIECIADKFAFKCVWQQPELKVMINQFMNQLSEEDDFGDKSPNISDLLSAISAPFPSGAIEDISIDEAAYHKEVPTSTPQQKTEHEMNSSNATRRNDKMDFHEFNDASPILFTSRNRQVFMKRRCRLSFDSDDDLGMEKKLKTMKI